MGPDGEISITIVLILFLIFPGKSNKIFQTIKKQLDPKHSNYLPCSKKSEKTKDGWMMRGGRLLMEKPTDGQTENGDFIGPFIGRGSNNFLQTRKKINKISCY